MTVFVFAALMAGAAFGALVARVIGLIDHHRRNLVTNEPDAAASAALTLDDVPTLRRVARFMDERARHRGWIGSVVCRAQAMVCRRLAAAVERYRMLWPAEMLDSAGRITQSRTGR